MTPSPVPKCEACGHPKSVHTLGDGRDDTLGTMTPPYCEGSDDCMCPGAVFFAALSASQAEVVHKDKLVKGAIVLLEHNPVGEDLTIALNCLRLALTSPSPREGGSP